MEIAVLQEKDPDAASTYSIDWSRRLVLDAQRSTDYALATVVRAPRDTGFWYVATVAGRSSARWPELWPRQEGESVMDGSVQWTARHPADVTTPIVESAVWTVPDGITKDSQNETATVTHITLSGGTHGVDYELTCRMTPVSGNPIEQSVIIPVRHQ